MRHESLINRSDARLVSKEASKASALALAALIAAGSAASASSAEEDFPEQDTSMFFVPEYVIELPSNDPKVIYENSQIVVGNPDYSVQEELDSPEKDTKPEGVLENEANKKHMKNLFHKRGFSYQDPNMTTCGPVTIEMALNFTALKGEQGEGFVYKVNTSYENEMRLRRYARMHDALFKGGVGTDPLGIVRTINEFGWDGDEVYKIFAYKKFNKAVKHIVRSVAKHGKPAIIAGWGGAHAQLISGYEVEGEDPEQSDNYKVKAVYLTSPLKSDGQINKRITYNKFRNGNWNEAFIRYNQGDSPYDNPLTPIKRPASNEWDGKFVVIASTK